MPHSWILVRSHSWVLVRFIVVRGIFVTVIVVLTLAGIVTNVGETIALILNVVHLDIVLKFAIAIRLERRQAMVIFQFFTVVGMLPIGNIIVSIIVRVCVIVQYSCVAIPVSKSETGGHFLVRGDMLHLFCNCITAVCRLRAVSVN